MARIRSIKPEFCVSEQLAECSTNARLVFALMWMFCDDQGIHPAKCRTLKGEIFPLDEKITTAHVQSWVNELIAVGLLREFEVNSDRYWQVTGWKKHQKIDKPSHKYPLPLAEDSPSPPRKLDDASPPEGSRVEGKGVKGAARATRLPTDWTLPLGWREWVRAEKPQWPLGFIDRTADAFRDYWVAAPRGTKLDWEATWRNWVRNTKDPKPGDPTTDRKPWEGAH